MYEKENKIKNNFDFIMRMNDRNLSKEFSKFFPGYETKMKDIRKND